MTPTHIGPRSITENSIPQRVSRRLLAGASILSLLGSLLVTVSISATPALADDAQRTILDRHHVDAMSVQWENGNLLLRTRADLDSGAGKILDPDKALLHLPDTMATTVPALPALSFLGEPGTPVWMISQTFSPNVLWAGWEAESLPRGTFQGEGITLVLTGYSGPGNLEIYQNQVDGPQRTLSSRDNSLRSIPIDVGSHTHANWMFDQPGRYELTFQAEATLLGGDIITSPEQTYVFVAGPLGNKDSDPTEPDPKDSADPAPTDPVDPDPVGPDPVDSGVRGPEEPGDERTRTEGPTPTGDVPSVDTPAVPEQCIAVPTVSTVQPENVSVATSGHFDFGPVVQGGSVHALLKDDRSSPAQWVDPAGVVLHLTDAAKVTAPGGAFSFLGQGSVWQIPLTQNADVPWLGWNTQHPTIAGTSGTMTLTLDRLEGPGDIAVYSVGPFGDSGEHYFGTVDGFPRSTSIPIGASGVHVHGIWAFTQPGAYYAHMSFSGSAGNGSAVLTFFVGEGDAASAAREQTITTYVGRTASGESCELTLPVTGPPVTQVEDLAGLAGSLLIVGLAFLGASFLGPRRRTLSTVPVPIV